MQLSKHRRSKRIAVERSLKMQMTITVESKTAQAVTEKATVIKATKEFVSSVAETVLKHETVQEVVIDRT